MAAGKWTWTSWAAAGAWKAVVVTALALESLVALLTVALIFLAAANGCVMLSSGLEALSIVPLATLLLKAMISVAREAQLVSDGRGRSALSAMLFFDFVCALITAGVLFAASIEGCIVGGFLLAVMVCSAAASALVIWSRLADATRSRWERLLPPKPAPSPSSPSSPQQQQQQPQILARTEHDGSVDEEAGHVSAAGPIVLETQHVAEGVAVPQPPPPPRTPRPSMFAHMYGHGGDKDGGLDQHHGTTCAEMFRGLMHVREPVHREVRRPFFSSSSVPSAPPMPRPGHGV